MRNKFDRWWSSIWFNYVCTNFSFSVMQIINYRTYSSCLLIFSYKIKEIWWKQQKQCNQIQKLQFPFMSFFWISNIFHISSTSNLSSFTISGQFLHFVLDILVNVHCNSYCRLSLAIWQTLYWFKIHDIGLF